MGDHVGQIFDGVNRRETGCIDSELLEWVSPKTSHYTAERMVADYERVYANVLDAHSGNSGIRRCRPCVVVATAQTSRLLVSAKTSLTTIHTCLTTIWRSNQKDCSLMYFTSYWSFRSGS